jgi:hypothetical protein
MDKAALLGEVVRYVRELRGKASDAAAGVGAGVIPGEGDEVGVEEDDRWRPAGRHYGGGLRKDDDADAGNGERRLRSPRRVKAWVCCADRPGLMTDLGRAVRSVGNALPVRAEIATVGGRTRGVLVLDVCCDDGDCDVAAAATNRGSRAVAMSTLRAALRAVLLDRQEHLAAAEGHKRPRISAQIAEVQ